MRLVPYILFGALGGVIADRYEKRAVMVATDLARALLMFALTAAAVAEAPAAFALLFAFLATAAGTPEGPALGSILPKVCEEDELARANSVMSTVDHLALVIGPAIGALLLLLGAPPAAFAANGLTFLLAAFFASRVKTRTVSTDRSTDAGGGMASGIREGIGGIRASGTASLLIVLMVASAALYGFELVFTVLLAEGPLEMGSEGVGWLTAAVGTGGVIGAMIVGRLSASRRGDLVIVGSVAAMGLPFAGLALNDVVVLALVLMAFIGAGNVLFEVISTTILQRVVPESLLARVLGIQDSLSVAAMLAGSVLAPVLVNLIGLRPALVAVGISLPAACVLMIPKLGELRKEANRTMDKLAPIVELLERSGAFDGASRQVLEAAASACTPQDVSAGDVVIREGDEPDDFFVVAQGLFEVTSRGEAQGPQQAVNVLQPGDYFGEIGLLRRHPRTASVRAKTAGQLVRLPGAAFLESVQQAPSPPALLMSSFANRLRRTHPSLDPSIPGGAGA